MAFADDLAALNSSCVATFGTNSDNSTTPTTYTPLVGAPYQLNGVLSDPTELDSASAGGYAQMFSVNASDFQSPPSKGDTIAVGTFKYRVQDIFADAGGMTELALRLDS